MHVFVESHSRGAYPRYRIRGRFTGHLFFLKTLTENRLRRAFTGYHFQGALTILLSEDTFMEWHDSEGKPIMEKPYRSTGR